MSSSPSLSDHARIYQLLTDPHRPHLIGRIAGIELKVAASLLTKMSQVPVTDRDIAELENNAGIHTTSYESLKEYAVSLLRAYEACSFIAEWPTEGKVFQITGAGQDFIARRTPSIPKGSALSLEPYYLDPSQQDNSWLSAVRGKRVLILHPFVRTFQKQLAHLSELYPGRSWLEECEIRFLCPPLTLAGNHQNKDWKEHYTACLTMIRQEYQERPFDIALVGAGGYGMLLSHALVSELGVSTVYIGGALQLFFGVIGKRWFTNKQVMALVNPHWTRPLKEDQPVAYQQVEKGCYW
jgi:hypothetical protein